MSAPASASGGERLKLFILAGEPSGDRIAADLVARLKPRVDLTLTGVGGHELEAQGLHSLFPMSDLAVMGISDVLLRLPLLLWRIEQTARAIHAAKPDIVVLVDSQDFSKLLARRLKRLGYAGKLILYVAPSVWARAPQRAAKLKPLFEDMSAIRPWRSVWCAMRSSADRSCCCRAAATASCDGIWRCSDRSPRSLAAIRHWTASSFQPCHRCTSVCRAR
jgi:lipid-A-disaccharide synthase